jgi:hypothetical protein
MTKNMWQGLITGVVDTGEQPIAGVVDTGDKHSFTNITTNLQKNQNVPMENSGAQENWFMKKPEVKNLLSDSLLSFPYLKQCIHRVPYWSDLEVGFGL